MRDPAGPSSVTARGEFAPGPPDFLVQAGIIASSEQGAVLPDLLATARAGDPDAVAAAAAETASRLLGGRVALALVFQAGRQQRFRVAAAPALPYQLRRHAERLPARLRVQAEECLFAADPDPVRVWAPPAAEQRLASLLAQFGCATLATISVRNENAPSALLVIGIPHPTQPTEAQSAAMLTLVQHTAAALVQAEERALQARRAARLDLVSTVSKALASAADVVEAVRQSVTALQTLVPFSTLLLFTADEARAQVRLLPLSTAHLPPLTPLSFPLTPDALFSQDRALTRVALRRAGSELERALWDLGLRAGVRAPLVARGRVLGAVLALDQHHRRYSETDLVLLEDLAQLLAPAVESHLLQEHAAETQRELRHLTSSLVIANEHLHTLTQRLEAAAKEQQDFSREAVLMLATAAEAKDQITGDHLHRIQHLSVALGRALRLPAGLVAELGYASMLHDVGKLHVPDSILRKPGPLTPEEWDVIRQHPAQGVRILGRHPAFALAREICLAHHERWDGSGYPRGLTGEAIPLSARLVAVADVFDSLVSPRPYKPAWAPEKALAYIADQSGRHFDPAIVAKLLELWERGEVQRLLAAEPERVLARDDERHAHPQDQRTPALRANALARRWVSIVERVARTLGPDSAALCFARARQRVELRRPLDEIFVETPGDTVPRLRLERLDERQVIAAEAVVREYLHELHQALAEMVGEPVASVLLTLPDTGLTDRLDS